MKPAQIEILIDSLSYGGEGVGRLDGKVCFVEGALPGEKVLAEITQDKGSFLHAKTVTLLTRSPRRIEAPCAYFGTCGGCQYQHTDYETEVSWKSIQAREYIARYLKIDGSRVQPLVPSPSFYNYRTSITLNRSNKAGAAGFVARDNKTVIPVDTCLLADAGLTSIFQQGPSLSRGEDSLTYRIGADGRVVTSRENKLFQVQTGSTILSTHSRGFFQNNLAVTELIGQQLKSWVKEFTPEIFVDLYAGAGTFTLLGASEVTRLVCVESNPYSIEALQRNAKELGLTLEILKGAVEKRVNDWLDEIRTRLSMVFLDPPRKGIEPRVAKALGRHAGAEALVYLSCHLGTLTRDLRWILEAGRYEVRQIIPYDMFPRTKHIELLVLLTRRDPV